MMNWCCYDDAMLYYEVIDAVIMNEVDDCMFDVHTCRVKIII